MKKPSNKDLLVSGIIAIFFLAIGLVIGYFVWETDKINPLDNSKVQSIVDSLNREIRADKRVISNRDSLIKGQSIRLVQRDSLYIHKHIKDKNEIKYINSLDSIGISNRIDSILKMSGHR